MRRPPRWHSTPSGSARSGICASFQLPTYAIRDEPRLDWVGHLACVLDVPIDALLAPAAAG